jgi:hypothetical protein
LKYNGFLYFLTYIRPNGTSVAHKLFIGSHYMTEQSAADVLVVVSKLKKYIKDKAELNTSGAVADTLSSLIRVMCDKAIENAKNEGRKTVMERDFEAASGQN